jgi:hypothetical protein
MCFVLYAGTVSALPRVAWNKEAPDLSVESLPERDAAIRQYFSNPEVQNVGSTSGCGCDFPNVMLQNGEWPTLGTEEAEKDEFDKARATAVGSFTAGTFRFAAERLVAKLVSDNEETCREQADIDSTSRAKTRWHFGSLRYYFLRIRFLASDLNSLVNIFYQERRLICRHVKPLQKRECNITLLLLLVGSQHVSYRFSSSYWR